MKPLAKILKWGAIGLGSFIVIAVAASLAFGKPGYKSPEAQQENKPAAPVVTETPSSIPSYAAASTPEGKRGNDIVSVGLTAYLRIPNNSDSESVLFLSPDSETYNAEMAKLTAVKNDPQATFYQMGELAAKGWFGVSNGTQIVVLDKQGILDPLYQVRIMKGMRSVDDDKIGKSGWIARTFISKN